jgi:hypothetical protein
MVNSHEQGALTRFLRLDSLEKNLVKFPICLELWIINYELTTNYQGLTIKSVFNNLKIILYLYFRD